MVNEGNLFKVYWNSSSFHIVDPFRHVSKHSIQSVESDSSYNFSDVVP